MYQQKNRFAASAGRCAGKVNEIHPSGGESTTFDRITSDPDLLSGKLIIRGTRISVEMILEWFASGATRDQILARHLQLTAEDIEQALAYAAAAVRNEVLLTAQAGGSSQGMLDCSPTNAWTSMLSHGCDNPVSTYSTCASEACGVRGCRTAEQGPCGKPSCGHTRFRLRNARSFAGSEGGLASRTYQPPIHHRHPARRAGSRSGRDAAFCACRQEKRQRRRPASATPRGVSRYRCSIGTNFRSFGPV